MKYVTDSSNDLFVILERYDIPPSCFQNKSNLHKIVFSCIKLNHTVWEVMKYHVVSLSFIK